MELVYVTCANSGKIPGIGIGPITTPVCIRPDQYQQLKDQGYAVKKHAAPGSGTAEIKEGGSPKTPAEELMLLTVAQLKAKLDEAGKTYENNARKADLVALLLPA